MFFYKGTTYATVWKADEKDKYVDLRISTSEKAQDGKYVYSNWMARAIGHAAQNFRGLTDGDRIVIESAKISNETFEGKDGTKRSFLKVIILEGKKLEGNQQRQSSAPRQTQAPQPAAEAQPATNQHGDDLPF